MPTFSISGVLVARDGTDTNIAATPVTLDVVVPEGQTTFTYSILETFPDDLPEVDISTNDVAVGLSGAGVPAGIDITADDAATFLGTVNTTAGNFVALAIEVPRPGGGAFDAIFPIAGTVPAIPTNLAEFNALEGTVTGFATATGVFAPGATIDFGTLANTTFDASPNVVQGTDGDDNLAGTAGDDFIVTGNATSFGDFVTASTGNDTIDMSGNDGQNGFVALNYRGLAGPIAATIDGGTNTGSVDKGAAGTDTLLGVQQPLFAGWTNGGLDIRGTVGNDSFNLTPQGEQWMAVRGGDGVDSYSINGTGFVRMDFRDATQGIEIDLGTRQIADDGFGNAETIGGTNAVWEVYGSSGDDMFTGSGADESYRYFGGNNTLEGGAGFDRLRYDTGTVASVNIDASAGTVTGALTGGGSFTDTISGFERLRGSNGNDVIAGEAGVDNWLEGRDGADTLDGAGGNDTLDGGSGSDWFTIRTGATTIVDFELGFDVIDVQIGGLSIEARNTALRNAAEDSANGGAVADLGNGNTLRFANLSTAEVATLADAEDPGETNLVQGTDGDDFLVGTAGDDLITTGDATPNGDVVVGSAGDDTIDMTGMNPNTAFMGLRYSDLGSGIDVTINGVTDTGTVDKGAAGTDTLLGVANPMFAGWTMGGLGLDGTGFDDTFNVTLDDLQWMSIRGGAGQDTYTINTSVGQRLDPNDDVGALRLDMRFGDGIDVNLATGVIADDGYGNIEQIDGNAPIWEVWGSGGDDIFVGSDNAESYRYTGGNNTLDGGAGFDRLRYDSSGVASVVIDAANGVVTGTLDGGGTFTDTISGFERLRGSNGDDTIIGEAGVDNRYEGQGGSDTFVHLGGNDRISDFEIGADVLDLRELNVTEAEIAAALAGAVDTPDGALVSFAGGSSVLFDGLNAAAMATIQPLVSVPGETVTGGGTSDTLTGGGGDDTIDGGDGDDVINTGIGFDVVEGGGGNDLVQGLNGFDTLNGGTGNDTLEGNSGSDELNGGDGDDELQGGQGADLMGGGDGADLLVGREGFDTLEGGAGNDTLQGNFGRDLLRGGDGDDRLEGGVQADTLEGGDGADLLIGASGGDTLEGGAGDDTLESNNGNDVLSGGAGDDLLEGGLANDLLNGDAGNDRLEGGNGADLLNGGDGDDRLEGNAGNDTLDGGAGNDVLRGGLGADTFVFRLGSGTDRVVDFGNVDAVELEAALLGGGTPDPADLIPFATRDADGFLLLDFGGGDTLTFTGITNTGAILDDVSFI
jgi:Ca2+-binding RTX toxin-like protein